MAQIPNLRMQKVSALLEEPRKAWRTMWTRTFRRVGLPAAAALLGSGSRLVTATPDADGQVDDAQRVAAYGSHTVGADSVAKLLSAKLIDDAPVHTLAMQARGGVPGCEYSDRLLHLGADHSQPAAKAINVGQDFPNRMLWAASWAQTKAVHSVLLVPSTDYKSLQAGLQDLKARPGGPPRLFTGDAASLC